MLTGSNLRKRTVEWGLGSCVCAVKVGEVCFPYDERLKCITFIWEDASLSVKSEMMFPLWKLHVPISYSDAILRFQSFSGFIFDSTIAVLAACFGLFFFSLKTPQGSVVFVDQ